MKIKNTPKKKGRSAIPKGGNDCIMTPDSLALAIVKHFQPTGFMCDPCSGEGSFLRAFESQKLPYCSYEIKNGTDFLAVPDNGVFCHWIITNPPWSQFLAFLKRSMSFATDVVFLANFNAWGVRARINAMQAAGFHFREIAYVETPRLPWPQFGLQLAAVHIRRTPGLTKFSNLDWQPEPKAKPAKRGTAGSFTA